MGYVFTDVPHPAFDKVCDGLYYRAGEPWEKAGVWGSKPHSWLHYPKEFGPLPYLREELTLYNVNLLSNFPWAPYNVIQIIADNLNAHNHQDSICILNHQQGGYFEDILLDFGFRVVNRTVNPKHNSRLILYHKEPAT